MIKKNNAPGSAITIHRGNMNKLYTKHILFSLAGYLQSKIKVMLLEMCCRGYLSVWLTKAGFRLFRLKAA